MKKISYLRIKYAMNRYCKSNSTDTVKKERLFTVDRSGLIGFKVKTEVNQDSTDRIQQSLIKEPLTPLAGDLLSYIKMRGPITLNEFMAQASNNRRHGYYQNEEDKIGVSGDFVTSPEISQIFGEIICIWIVSLWKILGSPRQLSVVELGPGNGTLMSDILRAAVNFPDFKEAIAVHMVELSPVLRRKQALTLGCQMPTEEQPNETEDPIVMSARDEIPIHWHRFLRTLPREPAVFVGQEFLDTFPVHQFCKRGKDASRIFLANPGVPLLSSRSDTEDWKEVLVDADESDESPLHFRLVMSPMATPAVKILLGDSLGLQEKMSADGSLQGVGVGGEVDGMEVSPMAAASLDEVSERIVTSGGAALFVDYGENYVQADTLRAFLKHKQVHPLSRPGDVDVTADVDFSAMARTAREVGATVLGPVTQREFLIRMGLVDRVQHLIGLDSTTDEQAEQLVNAVGKLAGEQTSNGDMGLRFKVLGLYSRIPSEDKPSMPIEAGFPGFS